MQPELAYVVALVVSVVLLAAVCVGWILDRRAPAGQGLGVGASFAVVFGVGVTQTSGFALICALLEGGNAFKALYVPIVAQYVVLSIAAVIAMLVAQIAAMVGRRAGVRVPSLWFAACAVLSVISLGSMWVALRVLLTVQYLPLTISVYLAPVAMAAVLTALLLARAIAFIVSPQGRPVPVVPQPVADPEPMTSDLVPTEVPNPTDAVSAYRRPPAT